MVNTSIGRLNIYLFSTPLSPADLSRLELEFRARTYQKRMWLGLHKVKIENKRVYPIKIAMMLIGLQ